MGWVYQYWSTELKNEVYDKLARRRQDRGPLRARRGDRALHRALHRRLPRPEHPGRHLGRDAPRHEAPGDAGPTTSRRPPGNPPVEREHKRVRDLTLIDPCVGIRPLPRPGLRPLRPALRRRGDRAAARTSRASSSSATSTAPTSTAGRSRSPPSPSTSRAARSPAPTSGPASSTSSPATSPSRRPRLPTSSRASRSPNSRTSPGASGQDSPASAPSARCSIPSARSTRPSRSSRHRSKGTLWADDTDWAKKRAHFMTGLRTAFTAAAGDTDLSTRLFGEEASRGLDALQILGRRYDVVVTNPPYGGLWEFRRPPQEARDRAVSRRARRDLYAAFILRCRELCTSRRLCRHGHPAELDVPVVRSRSFGTGFCRRSTVGSACSPGLREHSKRLAEP